MHFFVQGHWWAKDIATLVDLVLMSFHLNFINYFVYGVYNAFSTGFTFKFESMQIVKQLSVEKDLQFSRSF